MNFCRKCGSPLGKDGICPKCGTKKSGGDKKIISCRYRIGGRMIAVAISGVIIIWMGLMFLSLSEIGVGFFYELLGLKKDLSEILSILSGFLLIFFVIGSIWLLIRKSRSCITVYQGKVEGTAISGKSNPFAPNSLKLEKVSLKYTDIQNCTLSKERGEKKLILYTQYGNYEFLGGSDLQTAAAEIKKRIVLENERDEKYEKKMD